MDIAIAAVRFLCLMVSNFGYYNLLRKKTDLNVCFIPLVTISIQFSVLFLAGLFNLLLAVSLAMMITGILLIALDMCHKNFTEYRSFQSISYGYMGICMVLLFLCLYGSKFFHFDDFSHWATVVQEMLATNAYPSFKSPMIIFKSYPLGSSTYIYYCCLLAGTEESTMMLIQAFMLVCALMPLFGVINSHRICTFLFMLFFTNFLLVYNTSISSLMVDSLLPIFGMGSFLVLWNTCIVRQKTERNKGNADIWVAGPLLAMTVMIKNSGFFFALPSFLMLAIMQKRNLRKKNYCGMGILMPLVYLLLWRNHCRYLYPDAMETKHAVSFAHYAQEFGSKSWDVIANTGWKILEFFKEYSGLGCILFLLAFIVIIHWLFDKKGTRETLQFSGAILCMYLLYVLGLYGMYIFSMPEKETRELDELLRYVKTMDAAVFYLLAAYILKDLEKNNFRKTTVVLFISAIILWGGLSDWQVISGVKNSYPRQWLEDQIQQYQIPLGTPCVINNHIDEGDGYPRNIVSYLLWTPYIYKEDSFEKENQDKLNEFSYIIMMDYETEAINQWVRDYYPEQYGNAVIVTEQAQKTES